VFGEVRAEELYEGRVRSTKEYNGVQLDVRIVPVECPVGRR
jgi:hypothetical protein